jgi:hypothetical protein
MEPGSVSEENLQKAAKKSGWLLENIRARNFPEPTPIQRQAIPCLLSQRELLAVAPTGMQQAVHEDMAPGRLLHDIGTAMGAISCLGAIWEKAKWELSSTGGSPQTGKTFLNRFIP